MSPGRRATSSKRPSPPDSAGATPPPRRLSAAKKGLFSLLVTITFFVAMELLLAGFGVQPILYDEDPYVGFASYVPLFVREDSSDGPTYMVTAPNKRKWFNSQRLLQHKPTGRYRIFCMGGSTTYGHPYDDTVSFCGWLREFLRAADPSREWEVINAGGHQLCQLSSCQAHGGAGPL